MPITRSPVLLRPPWPGWGLGWTLSPPSFSHCYRNTWEHTWTISQGESGVCLKLDQAKCVCLLIQWILSTTNWHLIRIDVTMSHMLFLQQDHWWLQCFLWLPCWQSWWTPPAWPWHWGWALLQISSFLWTEGQGGRINYQGNTCYEWAWASLSVPTRAVQVQGIM